MIDAILYGYDLRGLLNLREKNFDDLRDLARYFEMQDGDTRWLWAEVEISDEPGQVRVIKYTADILRGMIVESMRTPSVN